MGCAAFSSGKQGAQRKSPTLINNEIPVALLLWWINDHEKQPKTERSVSSVTPPKAEGIFQGTVSGGTKTWKEG